VAFYVLFLLFAQFEHHDLLCHLKTPQHCTACSASVVGSDAGDYATCGAAPLADAGCAASVLLPSARVLLAPRTTGRSPPAF